MSRMQRLCRQSQRWERIGNKAHWSFAAFSLPLSFSLITSCLGPSLRTPSEEDRSGITKTTRLDEVREEEGNQEAWLS